jgi:hypothetical protein
MTIRKVGAGRPSLRLRSTCSELLRQAGHLCLATVPLLVGVDLLAHFEAESLHPLYRLVHLRGLLYPVQLLILDLPVQRLNGVLGEPRYAPQPIQDRVSVLHHKFAVRVHAFFSLGLTTPPTIL